MKFGEQIKKLRKEKHITQLELAQKIGVDFTYISKMENNRMIHSPSEEIIMKLAKVLETGADQLILLAQKVPKNLQKTIVDDPLAVNFLRAVPKLSEKQRQEVEELINKTLQE